MDLRNVNLSTFRIKTKEEFEEEFGSEWRDNVEYTFPSDMDYLLGKRLIEISIRDKYRETIYVQGIDNSDYTRTYSISEQMITKVIKTNKKSNRL